MDRWDKNKLILQEWISDKITQETVDFAKEFGTYLATTDSWIEKQKDGKQQKMLGSALTTSQLRRFFGEVKRQQIIGYAESSFVMLSPKLAYAVGRARKDKKSNVKYCKIEDLYHVLSKAIDLVIQEEKEKAITIEEAKNEEEKKKAILKRDKHLPFKNFISIFEAIVAYHKAAE